MKVTTVILPFLIAIICIYIDNTMTPSNVQDAPTCCIFLLDVSQSMLCQETHQSRFQLACDCVQQCIHLNPTDEYALVAFDNAPHLIVPNTSDAQTLLHELSSLSPDSFHDSPGSNPAGALDYAQSLLTTYSENAIAVFLTDGSPQTDLPPSLQNRIWKQRTLPVLWTILSDNNTQTSTQNPATIDDLSKTPRSSSPQESTPDYFHRWTSTSPVFHQQLHYSDFETQRLANAFNTWLTSRKNTRNTSPCHVFLFTIIRTASLLGGCSLLYWIHLLFRYPTGRLAVLFFSLFLAFTSQTATGAPQYPLPILTADQTPLQRCQSYLHSSQEIIHERDLKAPLREQLSANDLALLYTREAFRWHPFSYRSWLLTAYLILDKIRIITAIAALPMPSQQTKDAHQSMAQTMPDSTRLTQFSTLSEYAPLHIPSLSKVEHTVHKTDNSGSVDFSSSQRSIESPLTWTSLTNGKRPRKHLPVTHNPW